MPPEAVRSFCIMAEHPDPHIVAVDIYITKVPNNDVDTVIYFRDRLAVPRGTCSPLALFFPRLL